MYLMIEILFAFKIVFCVQFQYFPLTFLPQIQMKFNMYTSRLQEGTTSNNLNTGIYILIKVYPWRRVISENASK